MTTPAPRADEGAERPKPHLLHGVFDGDGLTKFRLECPYEVKGVLPAGRRCWSLDDDGEIDSLQCFAKGWVDECGAELISFEITDPSFPIEVDVELHGPLQTPSLTLHMLPASSGDGGAPTGGHESEFTKATGWVVGCPQTLGDAMRLIGGFTESEGGDSAETLDARRRMFDAYEAWCHEDRPETEAPGLTASQRQRFEAVAERALAVRRAASADADDPAVPEEGPPWPAEALALLPVFRAMTSRDGWLRIMGWDQTSTWRCYGRAPADSGLMWCERSGWLFEFGGNPHHPVCPECGGIDVDRENDQ